MKFFVVALLLAGSAVHAQDRFACFGAARYVAMSKGYTCDDLVMMCAAARAIYQEAGNNRAAAEKLARERGHDSISISLAKAFCKP